MTYDGRIDYDGVVVGVRKRFSDRFMLGVSSTGSRSRDHRLTAAAGSGFRSNNHPAIDYGPTNLSAPHILVTNVSVHLPGNVDVNAVSGPDFGAPVASFPGREVQIGVRYLFGR